MNSRRCALVLTIRKPTFGWPISPSPRCISATTRRRQAKELNPNYPTGRFIMAATLVALGRLDEARAEVQAGLALNPGFTLRRYREGAQSDNSVFLKGRERIIENMRKAGVPEG
jgi:hypothetical protein